MRTRLEIFIDLLYMREDYYLKAAGLLLHTLCMTNLIPPSYSLTLLFYSFG